MRLALLLGLLASALAHADLSGDIDRLFTAYAKPGAPGAAVLVLRNGAAPLKKVYGLAELSTKRATTSKTNFRLASLSKQFTAMAALILVDEGLLDLDETLQDVFPDFPDYGKKVQIQHLLHHTSGLKNYEGLLPRGFRGQVDDAWVVNRLKEQRSTDFTPGARYSYSNTGYCVLAHVVATRSKKPYADFVKAEIFDALGMDDSRVTDTTPPAIPERAYGYTASGGSFSLTDQSTTSATQGDGGIYTSLDDYQKWIAGFSSLLSLSTHRRLFERGRLNDGSAVDYGAGWSIDTYRGKTRYSHTGSSIGFRTAVQYLPDSGTVVLVLVNRANASPWDEAKRILDLVVGNGR